MAKPIIAVDIDDVLSANAAGFVAYSNERWGTNLKVADYEEHWSKVWQVDAEETERRAVELHASGRIGQYDHFVEAVEVLQELQKRYRLIIATSRRISIKHETQQWIDRNFPGIFENIFFAGIYDNPIKEGSFHKTKLETLQECKATYLIDDQLKHCQAASEAGIEAILFGDYPWNHAPKLPPRVTRCKDWLAVQEYFDAR